MNLFRRIRLTWRSWINPMESEAEQVLDAAIDQMDEHLAEARQLLAYCEEEGHRLVGRMADEQQREMQMRDRARQALLSGQETLAHEAMRRSLRAGQQSRQYLALWEQQQSGITRAKGLLDQLELQRADFERRRQRLQFRRQLAKARRVMATTLYGERKRGQVEWAEEEILAEELSADAYLELGRSSASLLSEIDDGPVTRDSVERALQHLRTESDLPPHKGSPTGN